MSGPVPGPVATGATVMPGPVPGATVMPTSTAGATAGDALWLAGWLAIDDDMRRKCSYTSHR